VQNTKNNKRDPSIDALRAIAILLVMFNHVLLLYKPQYPSYLTIPRLGISSLQIGGWSGVDLFFVLSGFLVSGLLFDEFRRTNKINPGKFLIRRGFKIYPSFFFFILLTFFIEKVLNLGVNGATFTSLDYLKDLFFLHNYLGGRWIITWSLDVEEAFYFLLTAFFLSLIVLRKLNLRSMIFTYLVLLIGGATLRLFSNLADPEYSFEKHYAYTHFRLDALFFGVLLAY
jgi:peptidoglycan/LPS O-acetylase OafA/YrhL